MNGVSATGIHSASISRGWPATSVLRLTPQQPLAVNRGQAGGSETVLAGVTHPPRGGAPKPLSAIVPDVLARYGLAPAGQHQTGQEKSTVDLVA